MRVIATAFKTVQARLQHNYGRRKPEAESSTSAPTMLQRQQGHPRIDRDLPWCRGFRTVGVLALFGASTVPCSSAT